MGVIWRYVALQVVSSMAQSWHSSKPAPRAAVINVSAPHYNLGARKLHDWLSGQGYEVEYHDGDPGLFLDADLVALSVIFSWDAPKAREIAWRVSGRAEVWAGGPGLFKLASWWNRETGLTAHIGLDQRFEHHRGKYRMAFASRGCPVNCWFCIVPKMEGKRFSLYWNFRPAPILLDNNLSALPAGFQCHIVRTYSQPGAPPLLDANSGFEPATFDWYTFARWKYVLRGPWRFAFDYMPEVGAVRRMMEILREVPSKKKRVYVLIGNEPMESCFERAMKVIEWGGEPFCQPVLPLDFLGGPIPAKYDWTEQRLKHFARYFNRFLWKYTTLAGYRDHTIAPFRDMAFAKSTALQVSA